MKELKKITNRILWIIFFAEDDIFGHNHNTVCDSLAE